MHFAIDQDRYPTKKKNMTRRLNDTVACALPMCVLYSAPWRPAVRLRSPRFGGFRRRRQNVALVSCLAAHELSHVHLWPHKTLLVRHFVSWVDGRRSSIPMFIAG